MTYSLKTFLPLDSNSLNQFDVCIMFQDLVFSFENLSRS